MWPEAAKLYSGDVQAARAISGGAVGYLLKSSLRNELVRTIREVHQGLCGTGLAYVIYYFIVENLGAVAASGVTYIPPVVALLIGVFLVGETINPTSYAAMILILAGVAVLQFGSRSRSRETSKGQTTVTKEVEGSTAAGLDMCLPVLQRKTPIELNSQ